MRRRSSRVTSLTERASAWLLIGGRLKPGVVGAQAAADWTRSAARSSGRVSRSEPRHGPARYSARRRCRAQRADCGVSRAADGDRRARAVVACANVAGVLLARARRGAGDCGAAGDGRGTRRGCASAADETLLLFVLGGAAGLLLARVLTSLLVAALPALPFPVDVSLALDCARRVHRGAVAGGGAARRVSPRRFRRRRPTSCRR